jgi:hypothetical protein
MTDPKCPLCRKPAANAYKPFCSRRCADVDLHRWLTGGYAIAAVEGEEEGDEGDAARYSGDRDARD